MSKKTKKEKHIREIWQHLGAYPDFIQFISRTTKSIDIQCKQSKILKAGGTDIMLDDLINEYNLASQVHYTKEYTGCFRSRRFDDAGKYIRRFRKEVIEAINRRYAAGFNYAGKKREEVLHTVETFFGMLL